jgi:hypothetical protein
VAPRLWVRVAAMLATSAIVVAVGLQAVARPAAALSICSTENCATLAVSISGDGRGSITSDDGYIHCSYSVPTTSGTCGERVIWGAGGPTPDITLTVTPAAGSVACYFAGPVGCEAEGVSLHIGFTLAPNDADTEPFEFHTTTRVLSAAVSGNGSGTVIGYSALINCPAGCTSVLP